MMRQNPPYLSHTARRTEPPLRRSKRIEAKGPPTPPGGPFAAFLGQFAFSPLAVTPGSVVLMKAVFIDLDRTLLRQASGRVLNRALGDEGVIAKDRSLPGEGLLYGVFDLLGENALSMTLARAAARVATGWDQEEVRRAAKRAVPGLLEIMAPFALDRLEDFRSQGFSLVLATTTPADMVGALAEALGFDDVIATRYEAADGHYTGRIDGGFVWGLGKLAAVKAWAAEHDVDLAECHACSDSVFDTPLLSSVGVAHPVNPDPRLALVALARRWPIEHWDRPEGVPSLLGLEPFDLLRPFVRRELFPYARFEVTGLEHIPREGPVLIASNHRSYFDMPALAILAASLHRPVRALAKQEMFSLPLVGHLTRAIGGIAVDRDADPAASFERAARSLRAGECVFILPQGTIPRGDEFFNPILTAKTGVARLAALTGAPVVPVGLWGTDEVWPRSAKAPTVTTLFDRPTVRITVGAPLTIPGIDAVAETRDVMAAITALLPEEARERRVPSAEELRRTYPSGTNPADEQPEPR